MKLVPRPLSGIGPVVTIELQNVWTCGLFEYFGEETNLLQILLPIAIHSADCAVQHGLEDEMKTVIYKMRQRFRN